MFNKCGNEHARSLVSQPTKHIIIQLILKHPPHLTNDTWTQPRKITQSIRQPIRYRILQTKHRTTIKQKTHIVNTSYYQWSYPPSNMSSKSPSNRSSKIPLHQSPERQWSELKRLSAMQRLPQAQFLPQRPIWQRLPQEKVYISNNVHVRYNVYVRWNVYVRKASTSGATSLARLKTTDSVCFGSNYPPQNRIG
jgi:hypothetical protein